MRLPGALFVAISVAAGLVQAAAPDVVLARYEAAMEQNGASLNCTEVAVDIEASLPRQAKQGRLRAIRRMVFGRPHYEVLFAEGDSTVRRQLIARYLSAQLQSNQLSSTSLAITRANYRFHYVASFGAGSNLSYVYRIKPRHRRVGLIDGEVWIDAASGLPKHESGRLVKSPSVFLRRVRVTQDSDYRQGIPERRITRLDIEARWIGPAEITVTEHPCRTVTTPLVARSNSGFGGDHDEACDAN